MYNNFIQYKNKALIILLVMFMAQIGFAQATFYVAPDGDDANPGTIESPYATIQHAHDNNTLQPGDTICLRGGTYFPIQQTIFNKAGNANNYLILSSYPGELPIINGQNVPEGDTTFASTPTWAFHNNAKYWKINGPLHLTNGRGAGVFIDGGEFIEFNLIELSYNGKRAARAGHGFFIWETNDALFNNCDSHHNANHLWRPNEGQSAHQYQHGDGWRIFNGENISLVGCRAWHNLDDGYDFTQTVNGIEMIECWAAYSGIDDAEGSITGIPNNPMPQWEGDGIKLGYGDDTAQHSAVRCLSWNNHCHGWTVRGGPYEILNSASYSNAETAYSGINNNSNTVQNTYGFGNQQGDGGGADDYSGITVTEDDFVSLDDDGMLGPRMADGGLPEPEFLKLIQGSQLIDTGIDVGIPYEGNAPDIGPFEYQSSLAVEILSKLQAKTKDKTVELKWSTVYEANNKGFELQRSNNTINWQKIGLVNGNNNDGKSYHFIDKAPAQGINYYRYKQFDYSSKYQYSNVVSIEFNSKKIQLFPNPTSGILNIVSDSNEEIGNVVIYNQIGQKLMQTEVTNNTINVSSLPVGIYNLEIFVGNRISSKKLVIKEQ